MSKNIRILAISHSFLRKINTSVYSLLKKKYGLKIHLVCPKFHLENTRKIVPDFRPDELDIEIFFQKTIFQHLRLKFYKNLNDVINKKKITHIILDIDLVSLQSFFILINSFLKNYKVCFYSNENNILNSKNIIKKNSENIFN